MGKITGGRIQEGKKEKKENKRAFFFNLKFSPRSASSKRNYMGADKDTRDTQEFFRPFLEFCTHALRKTCKPRRSITRPLLEEETGPRSCLLPHHVLPCL